MRYIEINSKMEGEFCPSCGGESKVFNSRIEADGARRRSRKCLRCGKRWKTREIIEKILK